MADAGPGLVVTDLRCEDLTDPLGLAEPRPRLGWRLAGGGPGARQVAARIRVASTPEQLAEDRPDLWDSGRVATPATAHHEYSGELLGSGARAHWTVTVWDEHERPTTSAVAWWEAALAPDDWRATWIGRPAGWPTGEGVPTCRFRRTFTLASAPRRARLSITALGIYDARCNGRRVGDERFAPGWTDYHHRLSVQRHDLTGVLRAGENAIEVELADGWYSGHVGFLGRERYGTEPELLAQLDIELADGTVVTIASDATWQAGEGSCRSTDLLMGEVVDLTHDDPRWTAARPTAGTDVPLVGVIAPPTRIVDERPALSCTAAGPGRWIYDVGQNLVGWARIRAAAPRGTVVTVRFAEVLDDDGQLYTANLRAARATDTFTLTGDGVDVLEPTFTFHGFRYLEIGGLDVPPDPSEVTAVVCATDLRPTGTFACSRSDVDRLHENIVWGMRGNFLEVPTDCPQRDERLGWTGDAQVFAGTAASIADVAPFFRRWLGDLVAGQLDDGAFPVVAPRLEAPDPKDTGGAPGWGDAGVLVPMLVHERYGDRRLLEHCFESMVRWVEHVRRANPGLLWEHERHGDMGDWLSIDADSPKDVIATSFFARSAQLVADAAALLGRTDDAEHHRALATAIRQAYVDAYVTEDGRIAGETQTVYALAVRFGLVDGALRDAVGRHLAADVEARGHLTTGFLGVAHLLPALTEIGRVDLAYRLLLAESCPSWLYAVHHGATTIWERWDGWTEEHGFQDPAMNSFNHYAFGAVGAWLHDTVLGIRPDPAHPGFERAILAPHPGGGLTWAAGSLLTPRGEISLRWDLDGDELVVTASLPPGCRAQLHLPTASGADVLDLEPGFHRHTSSIDAC